MDVEEVIKKIQNKTKLKMLKAINIEMRRAVEGSLLQEIQNRTTHIIEIPIWVALEGIKNFGKE